MNAIEQLTIARILKVNHAGEYGAVRIYRAQALVARRIYPDVVAFLEETLAHEVRHCRLFREAMPERGARPCRAMPLWSNGGFVLGLMTSLLSRLKPRNTSTILRHSLGCAALRMARPFRHSCTS